MVVRDGPELEFVGVISGPGVVWVIVREREAISGWSRWSLVESLFGEQECRNKVLDKDPVEFSKSQTEVLLEFVFLEVWSTHLCWSYKWKT